MQSRLIRLVLLGACLAGMVGCQKPLFTQKNPRTPYERYQVLRGRGRMETMQNIYGVDQPALRDRLKPLGD